MAKVRTVPPHRIVRDKEFAKRLDSACDLHPRVPPYNFGRLSWVRDNLAEHELENVSTETVRKWFSGESRPRPSKMKKLAALLRVDEAWLSLGITPEVTPGVRKAFNASAPGAVNLVAGMIQVSGGHPAFPEEGEDSAANLYAIINGKQHRIFAALGLDVGNDIKFSFPNEVSGLHLIGVVRSGPTSVDFLYLDPENLPKTARRSGGWIEVSVSKEKSRYFAKDDEIPKIRSFGEPLG